MLRSKAHLNARPSLAASWLLFFVRAPTHTRASSRDARRPRRAHTSRHGQSVRESRHHGRRARRHGWRRRRRVLRHVRSIRVQAPGGVKGATHRKGHDRVLGAVWVIFRRRVAAAVRTAVMRARDARGWWGDCPTSRRRLDARETAGVIEGHRSSADARSAQTWTRMRAVCVSYAFIIQMARLCSS